MDMRDKKSADDIVVEANTYPRFPDPQVVIESSDV